MSWMMAKAAELEGAARTHDTTAMAHELAMTHLEDLAAEARADAVELRHTAELYGALAIAVEQHSVLEVEHYANLLGLEWRRTRDGIVVEEPVMEHSVVHGDHEEVVVRRVR